MDANDGINLDLFEGLGQGSQFVSWQLKRAISFDVLVLGEVYKVLGHSLQACMFISIHTLNGTWGCRKSEIK